MSTLKFKTNIKCTGCLSKIGPTLDKVKGIDKWKVNLNDENKMLIIETEELNANEVIHIVEGTGFKAVNVSYGQSFE